MDEDLQYFGTKPFTLIVGPDEIKLYVPRGLLSQIPFFSQALKTDEETDSQKTELRMPDFDPRALADVLLFFWTQAVPELDRSKAPSSEEMQNAVTARVRAYVIAQELALEHTQKGIERQLVRYQQEYYVNPNHLTILHKSELRKSFLYKFLVAELGYDFVVTGSKAMEYDYPNFEKSFEELERTVLWDVLRATHYSQVEDYDEQPSKQDKWLDGSTSKP